MTLDRISLLPALALAGLVGAGLIGVILRLRAQVVRAQAQSRRADEARQFGERLRDAADPQALAPALLQALAGLTPAPVKLLLAIELGEPRVLPTADALSADERAGLLLCLSERQAFGPGTGRHEQLPAWYLPLRGRSASQGAALVGLGLPDPALREHAQALCDQMGQALERAASEASARQAQQLAATQASRNTLLAAISHDYRTPLACILGAASSLLDQDARLSPGQRQRLAASIVDETEALSRLTDNALQLARLDGADGPDLPLHLDWESAEELIGSVLRRSRQRRDLLATQGSEGDEASAPRLRARVEPGLPLLRCDALLLHQLLGNLVDNALKYAPGSAIELLARRASREGHDGRDGITLAVRDRGPGVPLAWRERVFEAFQRGDAQSDQRGAGVGLAACRAIARAHGGELRYRMRGHGGASFECWLPVEINPR